MPKYILWCEDLLVFSVYISLGFERLVREEKTPDDVYKSFFTRPKDKPSDQENRQINYKLKLYVSALKTSMCILLLHTVVISTITVSYL